MFEVLKTHICIVFACCVVCLVSCVQLFATSWTAACQAPLSMGILQARTLEWVAMPSSRGYSQPRDQTKSLESPALAGRFFTTRATWEVPHPGACQFYINY